MKIPCDIKKRFVIYTQHLTMPSAKILEPMNTCINALSLSKAPTVTFIYLNVFTGAVAVS